MEDKKSSFYEFLMANSKIKVQAEESKKVKSVHIFISWLVIMLSNSFILWLGWNYAFMQLFPIKPVTYLQSILLYSLAKVLTRGFFSVQ